MVRHVAFVSRDLTPYIRELWRTAVYVGRYGAQRVDDVLDWEPSKIARVAKDISDLLKKEGPKETANSGAW